MVRQLPVGVGTGQCGCGMSKRLNRSGGSLGKRNRSHSVSFSPDGTMVAHGEWGNVYLWDVQTGEQQQMFAGHTSWISSLAFSPDGTTVASGSWDDTVRLWDVKTGETEGDLFTGHSGTVAGAGFSPDGSLIVSGSWDDTVRLWDVGTGEQKGCSPGIRIGSAACRSVRMGR